MTIHISYNFSYDHTCIYIYTIWYIQFLIQFGDHHMQALALMVFSAFRYDLRKQKSRNFLLNCSYAVL